MKKLIISLLILSVCIFAGCDSSGSSDTAVIPPAVDDPDSTPALIPAGGYYSSYDEATTTYTVYNAGEPFPATMNDGDFYIYGGYLYRFDKTPGLPAGWYVFCATQSHGFFFTGVDLSALPATPQDITAIPGPILDKVNGKPVLYMGGGPKDLDGTFMFSKITSLAGLEIPSSVICIDHLFQFCTELTTASLVGFEIPSGIKTINSLFSGCTGFTGEISLDIPAGVYAAGLLFQDCSNVTSIVTALPEGVKNVTQMFYGCTSLTTLPANFTIPSSVTTMNLMFAECAALTDCTIIVNTTAANIIGYGYSDSFSNAGAPAPATGITVVCDDAALAANLSASVGSGHVTFTTSTP